MASNRTRLAIAAGFATQGFVFISLTTRLPDFSRQLAPLRARAVGAAADDGAARRRRLGARRAAGQAQRQRRPAPRIGLGLIAVAVPVLAPAPAFGAFVAGMAVYGVGLGVVDASTNMQAVALEHRYDRPILPVVPRRLDPRRHPRCGRHARDAATSRWRPPRSVALLPLVVLFAPFLRRDHGIERGREPGRGAVAPDRAGRACALVLFYMVDTAATTWGPTYLDDTFSTPEDLVALATFPYLVASGRGPAGRRPPGRPARRRAGAPDRRRRRLARPRGRGVRADLAGRRRSASRCWARAPP